MAGQSGGVARRSVVAGLGALALSQPILGQAATTPLAGLASARNLLFGTAIQSASLLETDSNFSRLVAQQCNVLVSEASMKWGAMERVRGKVDYSEGDRLIAFAADHHCRLRGHTLLWHANIPAWVEPAIQAPNGGTILSARIADTIAHYRGRVFQWDVVNEAIAPQHGRPDGLRDTAFLRRFGPDFISNAFVCARQADPSAALYYNDFGFETEDPVAEKRRRAVLGLLERLMRAKAPVSGFGLQSHLAAGPSFKLAKGYRAFLRDIAAMGLAIMVTELDVSDAAVAGGAAERDQAVAQAAKEFLDVTLDERAVKGIVTWGLTARYSWLNRTREKSRPDGQINHALPYDENYRPTPLWTAIASAFQHAPQRGT